MGMTSPPKLPGQDADPVRHRSEPGSGAEGWEPVITRPDPMTAEEWEACLERDLAEDLDPGELQCEDDFLNADADLTEADLAEIAGAMQARAAAAPGGTAGADPAGVAQVLAAQAGPLEKTTATRVSPMMS